MFYNSTINILRGVLMGQIILIIILVALGFCMVYFKDFIKSHKRTIEITIGIILVLSRIGRGTEYFIAQEYDRIVPLQLCSLSTYLALFYFLTQYKPLRPYLFFYGFLGLTAFIDPDIPVWSEAVKEFYLYGFTIDHLVITLAPLYLVLYDDYKFEMNDIVKPLIVAVVLVFISWPINLWWEGANFFYLIEKPVYSDVFGNDASTLFYIFWFFVAFFLFNAVSLLLIKLVTKSPTFLTNKTDA
jgi:hypothetical integral membrane protein (TIGR02206 family)